jgi:hypothetical protein
VSIAELDTAGDELTHGYARLREIENTIKELKDERAELISVLAPAGNTEYYDGDTRVSVAVVRRSRPVVNLQLLEMRDPALYGVITKRVLDSAQLNRSLDAGMWPEDLVEEVIDVVEDSPFLRFTDYTPGGEQ